MTKSDTIQNRMRKVRRTYGKRYWLQSGGYIDMPNTSSRGEARIAHMKAKECETEEAIPKWGAVILPGIEWADEASSAGLIDGEQNLDQLSVDQSSTASEDLIDDLKPVKAESAQQPEAQDTSTTTLDYITIVRKFKEDESEIDTISHLLSPNSKSEGQPPAFSSSENTNLQYSTHDNVIQRSPLVELRLVPVELGGHLFLGPNESGRLVDFRWKNNTHAQLEFYSLERARKAYEQILSFLSAVPNSPIKVTLLEDRIDAVRRISTINVTNLKSKDDIRRMIQAEYFPDEIEMSKPSAWMEDNNIVLYIEREIGNWYNALPSSFKRTADGRALKPTAEVACKSGRSLVSVCFQSAYLARSGMQHFLNTLDGQEPQIREVVKFFGKPPSVNSFSRREARISSVQTPRNGDETVETRKMDKPPFNLPPMRISRVQSICFSIPSRLQLLMEAQLLEFRKSCCGCFVEYETSYSLRTRNICNELHVYSHSTMNLARAKSALSHLLEGSLIYGNIITRGEAGEPVSGPPSLLFHTWFATEGKSWVRQLVGKHDVYVHVDVDRKFITVHGPRRFDRDVNIEICDQLLKLVRKDGNSEDIQKVTEMLSRHIMSSTQYTFEFVIPG